MRKGKLLSSLLLLRLFGIAQTLPPGVIQVDSILIDQTEITNLHWLEYLHYLKRDSAESSYYDALPDTTVWYQIYDDKLALAFSRDYLRTVMFKSFPVVGIDHNQASRYCTWRTGIVNHKLKGEKQGIHFRYRLPTPEEWTKVAEKSPSYRPAVLNANLDKMKFLRTDLIDIKVKSGTGTSIRKLRRSIIGFYKHNLIILFENLNTKEDFEFKPYLGIGYGPKRVNKADIVSDLRGNVSEMTYQEGIAMGGNWTNTYEETNVFVQFRYSEPSAVVGFRCICEIVAD